MQQAQVSDKLIIANPDYSLVNTINMGPGERTGSVER